MAASAGVTFDGSIIAYCTTVGGSYTAFGEITDIGGIGEDAPPIDMTHAESPDNRREYIVGIADGKELSLTLNYTRAMAGTIESQFNIQQYFKVTCANADTFIMYGIQNGFEHLGAVGDKLSTNISIKITGKVDHTAGA